MLNKITTALRGVIGHLLVNERINTQRCLAKDLDTTKTIIDHKQ